MRTMAVIVMFLVACGTSERTDAHDIVTCSADPQSQCEKICDENPSGVGTGPECLSLDP
ncbi:MAG: hypothetical protein KF773_26460 [Deltaproteobacteria bacterium]|nr:hypothetical protein [Deltaproteobacteria bacterium]MCW5804906.1 hypothetical protein [Deltaproteobacteria bacterium]